MRLCRRSGNWSADRRQKASVSHRERLGIPSGHRQVYGAHLPEEISSLVRPLLAEISRKKGRRSAELVASAFRFMAQDEIEKWADNFISERKHLYASEEYMEAINEKRRRSWAAKIDRKRSEARDEALEDAMLLFDEGLSPKQIAEALSIACTLVTSWLQETQRVS